jgi:hypothetical protein
MKRKTQLFSLLTMLCSGMAFAASPVAYVYVQKPVQGDNLAPIYAYATASNGKLTPIKGSPFHVTGNMIGNNGSHLITLGAAFMYSYDVSLSGAIGAQTSEIDTQLYSGSECGRAYTPYLNPPGDMDNTGSYAYAFLSGGSCYALQTYEVQKPSGDLTFKGSSIWEDACTGSANNSVALPTIAGDNLFAYSIQGAQLCNVFALFEGFNRESSGTFDINSSFSAGAPTPPPGGWFYVPEITQLTGISIAHDSSNHLAIPMQATKEGGAGEEYYPFSQIASYTIGKDGNLSTTNTWQDMATFANGSMNEMKMAPSGKLLAVSVQTGVQFYHFNGAKPITEFTGVIGTSGFITTMAWDADNHLYAINGATGRLHIYEATPTSVKEVSGSPYNDVCKSDSCTLIVRVP